MADQDLGTTIKFSVDATGVESGVTRVKRSLKDVGKTASEVGKQTGDAIGSGGDEAAKKMEAATRRISNEFKRLQIDAASMGKSLSEKIVIKADAYGIPRAAIEEQRAALKAFEDAQRAANPAMVQFQKLADASGTSVKGLSAALKQVPAQFTDIIVSLQGGQAPLTVLLQQGGQLKDTFGGIGNAARALGGYVVSLINPFTLAAGAVGTLGYAYFAGSKELDEYRKSLVLTGNAVGLTSGQMADMARGMAAVGGTQTAAANALVSFVNAGAAGSESLQKFAQSALNFEKVTGQAVEETAKQFAELGKNPLEASVKLNESTNFLTMSLYEQIKALEEQGKKTEAANVAQQAYSDTLNQNTAQITANLGTIEKGWNAIASATKGAWDWMKNIGRDTGPEQQLSKLRAEIASKEAMRDAPMALTREKEEAKRDLKLLNDQYEKLSKQVSLAQIRATDRGIEAQAVKDKIEWDKTHESQLAKLQQSLHKEVEDYAKLKAAGKDDAQTRLQYEQRIHHLVKQEADYLKGEYKTELKTTKPQAEKVEHFGKELTATKEWLATQERMLKDSYSTQQKDLEDSFKSQEITAAQYYARQLASDAESLQRREQVRAEAQARFDAEMATRVAVTQARPESKAKSTALKDLENEAKNFADAQEAARQKDINAMAKHSSAMAVEIDKESQKVTGSVDAYIADMQRKAKADATLLAAREAMAGQSPEIIAGMEAELKVRSDAAGLLDKTAESYALAAKNARDYESELQSQYDSGKEVTTAQMRLLEEFKAAAIDARIALVKLGGAIETTALDASITATAASIKKQTDEVAKEVQKTLADGIMSAGKDGGAGLRKTIEDVLITRPFRIVVEAMLQPVSNAIAQGIMGQSIETGAAGASGGLSSVLNGAALAVSNFGSNLVNAATAVATGSSKFLEAWQTGSIAMAQEGGMMAGLGIKIGAASPYIAAAIVAANAIERANGSVREAGVFAYGRNSADGFLTGGRADFIQTGGGGTTKNSNWFDPGEATSKYMSAMGDLVINSVKGWAAAIGLSADAVNGYAETVQAAIGNGMSKAEERQSIDKAMAGYGDAMVQSLFGQIMAFAKSGEAPSATLERMGNDVTAVNNILRDNGHALYDASFESAKAVQVLIDSVGGLDKFTALASNLETVNTVLTKLGKGTFELSMDGARAAEDLSKSVGGTAKLSEMADELIHVNDNLGKLGEQLLPISVAGAQAAHTMLTATDSAVKALEAAEKLEASYASFAKNLSKDPDTTQVASLQAIFDRAIANVTKFVPTIKSASDLTSVTYDQYTSYTEPQRTKLDAASSAYKSLQTAIDSAAKSAESAAKTAKDAADAAVKAYSDALKAIEKDTRNVNREIADFGKTDFQKKLSKIGYDSQDKLAELDELSAKAAELSAVATGASLKATDATLGAVSTMTDGLITASQDLSKDAQEVAGNIKDTLENSTAALGDALSLAPAISSLFDGILAALLKIPPALTLVSNAVTGIGSAATNASGGLTAFGSAANMAGTAAGTASGPITSAGTAFGAVAPYAAAAGAALNALGAAFSTAAAALTGLTGTFGAAAAAVDGLNAAFASAATGVGGLTSALSSASNAGANLAGSLGSIGGALSDISSAAAGAAGNIASAASALSAASSAAGSAQATVVVAAAAGGAIHGPGTSTSDSIPSMLSDGEYVIKAASVDKYGLGFLNALNAGTLKSTIYRAGGGTVDANASAQAMLLGLQTFESAVSSLGGFFEVLRNAEDKITSATIKPVATYASASATLGAAGYDVRGLDAAGVKALILGVLDANKPTVNQATGLLEFSEAQAKVLLPLAKVLGSVETVLKGLDEQKPWQDKLDLLTGKTTDRQQALQKDLASTTDATTQALIRQVYAQEDLNKVAKDTAEFAVKILTAGGSGFEKALGVSADEMQRMATLKDTFDGVRIATAKLAAGGLTPTEEATQKSIVTMGTAAIAQNDLNKAREKEIEWLTTTTGKLKSLTDTFSGQEVDLNRALGNDTTANKLQKDFDLTDVRKAAAGAQAVIDGPLFNSMSTLEQSALNLTVSNATAAEAQYDLNEARKKEISLVTESKSRLKSLTDAGASKEVERKRLLGDTAGADAAQEAIDLADVYKSTADATALLATESTELGKAALQATITANDAAIAQYKKNEATVKEIEVLQRYQSIKENLDSANLELLKAQGQAAQAFGLELAKATKGFTDAQTATYRQTQATQGLIAAYGNLSSTADTVTTSKIGLLTAQGDKTGAAELQRTLDIRPYTTAIATATEQLGTATTQGEKDILNLAIATNKQAIGNYDLSKSLDAQAEAANSAKQSADALAGRYASLADDLQSAKIALMRASGDNTGADQLEFEKATDGFDDLHKSMWRETQTIRTLTTARDQLNRLTASVTQGEIELMRARGQVDAADSAQSVLDTAPYLSAMRAAQGKIDEIIKPLAAAFDKSIGVAAGYDEYRNTFRYKDALEKYVSKNANSSQIEDLQGLKDIISTAQESINAVNAAQGLKYQARIAAEGLKLSDQLEELTKSTAEMDAKARSLVAAENLAIYDKLQRAKAQKQIEGLQDEAYKQSLDAQEAVTQAQQKYADVLRSTIENLQDFVKTLDGAATPTQNLKQARLDFQDVAGRASSGDTSAYKDLTPAAKAFLDLSKNYSKSIQDYRRDEAAVRSTLNAVIQANKAELDKLPAEIAKSADQTKEAWLELQKAVIKETNATVMLEALAVDQAASKRRLRTAEETLADRYQEQVRKLADADKLNLATIFNTKIEGLIDGANLPEYTPFDLGGIWGGKIADVLPKTPMTGDDLNKIISDKFPGLLKSDFHVPLTTAQLTELVNGKFPTLTVDNLIGVPADMVDAVNKQLNAVLPPGFAGQTFDARSMMQAAIDRAMGAITPAPVKPSVAPDLNSTYHNAVQDQGLSGGSSEAWYNWSAMNDEEIRAALRMSFVSNIKDLDYIAAIYNNPDYARNSEFLLPLKSYLHYKGYPGFAVGTNNVPQDMLAQIHKGEVIIPEAFNPERYSKATGNAALVEEIKALRAELAQLREEQKAGQNAIAANTRKTAQALTKFDTDGMPETRA